MTCIKQIVCVFAIALVSLDGFAQAANPRATPPPPQPSPMPAPAVSGTATTSGAEAPTPAPSVSLEGNEPEADASDLANPRGWGIDAFLQGRGRHQGVGLGLLTPKFWDVFAVRLGFSFDQVSYPGTSDHGSGQTVIVDLQFFPPVQDPDHFRPYLSVPLYTTFAEEIKGSEDISSNFSAGVLLGAEFSYWLGRSTAQAVPRAFFVEGGLMNSDVNFHDGTRTEDMFRGFFMRLGARM